MNSTQMKFEEKVYALCIRIPKGRVSTYRAIAEKMNTKAYRAVGCALKKNPFKQVPCHRVICSNGSLGGYRGSLKNLKKRMLRAEGVDVINDKIDLAVFRFYFV